MKVIIRKGHIYYKTTCKVCDCLFKFEEEDIESRKDVRDNQGVAWATEWTLTCPFCKKSFTVCDTCDVQKCTKE